jgi:hypothetical protein
MARLQRKGTGPRPSADFLVKKVGVKRSQDTATYELSHTSTIKIDPVAFENEGENLEASVRALKELKATFIAEINAKIARVLDELEAARQESTVESPIKPDLLSDDGKGRRETNR